MTLLEKLIQQAKKPRGGIGQLMLKIMNAAHKNTTLKGLGHIDIKADSIVLDIGCGGGETIKQLAKQITSGKVYGIDFSEDSVKSSTKANFQSIKQGKVAIMEASVSSMPFQENTFDYITAVQTHYFWPDLENDLAEVYRVLQKGGKFLIVAEKFKVEYHMTAYNTKEKTKELMERIGFKRISIIEESGWYYMTGLREAIQVGGCHA